MSLNINVNHARKSKVFHGGDQISGIVVANGPINEAATVVEIKFKGKSQTSIKRSNGQTTSNYKDKVKFFRIVQFLHRGALSLEQGASTSWPFTFHLPFLTEPEAGNPNITYSKDPSTPYAKAPHPLPPSLSLSGKKKGARYSALISYSLHASLQRHNLFSRPLHKSGNLPVAQRRPRAPEDGGPPNPTQTTTRRQDFTRATSRLLPDHCTRARSLREWARDTFTAGAPHAHFSLTVRSPPALHPGRAIPLALRFEYDAALSTAPTPPSVRLQSAEFVFKAHTHIRGRALLFSDVKAKPSAVVLHPKCVFAPPTTTPPPPPLVSGEGFDIGALGGWSLALPEEGRVVPTFDSYAVCRRYTAALTVRVMCAEKVFVARFKWAPVVVLAAGAESEDEDAVGELGKVEAVEGFWVGDAVEVGGQLLTGIMGVVGAFG